MSRLVALLSVIAVSMLVLPACSPPYVNIPAQTGDVASANPNTRNVRELAVASFQRLLDQGGVPTPVLIELPAGTDPLTYTAVAARIEGHDVLTPADEDSAAATLTLEQVRIRGWDAEVDVRRPVSGGVHQLVTVYLRTSPFRGWTVEYTRPWRGPITTDRAPVEEDL